MNESSCTQNVDTELIGVVVVDQKYGPGVTVSDDPLNVMCAALDVTESRCSEIVSARACWPPTNRASPAHTDSRRVCMGFSRWSETRGGGFHGWNRVYRRSGPL